MSDYHEQKGHAEGAQLDMLAAKTLGQIEGIRASGRWQPIATAPRDGTYILLAGPSGYMGTPLRVEVCKWDAEYRPRQPWVNYAGDSFLDGGTYPTCWMPLPEGRL